MIEIQSNYGGETIDNTENKLIKHMIEHGHLGYVPLIAHEKTDYPLRYETLIPRSYFVITKDIKNEYLKYLDFLYKVLPDIHNHPIIYKTQIRNPITKENECWHANIEQKLYERGQQIISIVRRNYTVRHMIPAQVDEGKGIKRIQSINMILAPTSQAYRIAGKYFNEKAPTAVHETNHIMLYVRLEKTKKNQTTQKNILVLKSMFPWTNH